MASKKYIELLDFSVEDLRSELKETSTQYQSLKFDHTIKGLDNPLQLRAIRRDIARLNTEIKKRVMANTSEV